MCSDSVPLSVCLGIVWRLLHLLFDTRGKEGEKGERKNGQKALRCVVCDRYTTDALCVLQRPCDARNEQRSLQEHGRIASQLQLCGCAAHDGGRLLLDEARRVLRPLAVQVLRHRVGKQ